MIINSLDSSIFPKRLIYRQVQKVILL